MLRLSPYFILSFLGHALLLAVVLRFLPALPEPLPLPASLVYVEAVPSEKGRPSRGRGIGGVGRRPLSLSELSVRPYGASDVISSEPGFEGSSSPSAILESAPRTVFFDRLHDRIDSAIYYPEEFKENGIEGIVTADLEWRTEGEKTHVHYRVSSASAFLRVFVIQRLRKIFNDDQVGRAIRRNESIKMRCQFHFEIYRREGKVLASHGDGVMGNQLTFYRTAKHRGEWKLGPLQGFAIAPQVGIDVDWFVRQFEEDRPDPLAAYRNDPEWRVN